MPEVLGPVCFNDALAMADGCDRRLLLHPSGASWAATVKATSRTEATAVFVGPEGGFSATEVGAAKAAGFDVVRLGAFVLRTETACAAALGALAALSLPGDG